MDLFTETLANYLTTAWHDIMADSDGVKEARFIVESLDPFSTFDLFSALEAYRQQALQHQELECHFKVARNLWDDWCQREDKQSLLKTMILKGAVDNGHLKWIDMEDRLTWYRSRTLAADKDGLVVVLLGLNHASDQGGLADFHLVDEHRLWNELGQSFYPWIERINERLSLEATDQEQERFDSILHQLFKVRPRSLVKLANFFEREIFHYQQDLHSLTEVIEHFYKALPFWGIPALFKVKKNNANSIKEADAFISYQRFKNSSEQNKAWEKIERVLADPNKDFDIPETLSGEVLYADLNAYKETLHDFIFKADTEAKNKLLQTDLSPILDILKSRTPSSSSGADKIFRLSGFGVEVILQAIWDSLLKLEHDCGGRPLADVITGIQVDFKRFNHDLEDDKEEGIASESLATELLNSCLGGLAELLADIDLRLPIDSDQALLHRDNWEVKVPIELDLDKISYGKSKSAPHLLFQIEINTHEENKKVKPCLFRWDFSSTHSERVRLLAAREILEQWKTFITKGQVLLPAFQMEKNIMTALYFAADEEEASRLVTQGFCGMKIINLVEDIDRVHVDGLIWNDLRDLSEKYRIWLQCYLEDGYYHAMRNHFVIFQTAYENFSERVLDRDIKGSAELLRRFYKAFLLVNEQMTPNDGYLRSAAVWGISPPVLELTFARECFLRDSFPEIIGYHLRRQNGKKALNRLFNLVEIHRPLAALVIDEQKSLSAEIKSFGLVHYLGAPPSTEKSLAVQTLLREEESDDDENVSDIVRETEESAVVVRVLEDYVQLYPFAEDGLRILAVHVEDLAIILSGVDKFLKKYLTQTSSEYPAFHCEVMIYSTSSSPVAVESRLMAWRDYVMEAYREKGRSLLLSVSHHFAPSREKMVTLLEKETRLYDIGFLFHFLAGELSGEAESTEPFKLFDFKKNHISQFPICEYPRPIQQGDVFRRQTLLSNRRLRIQTRHADLSARLRFPESHDCDHLIFGRINYQPWQKVVKAMHSKAQWLACIDPFVDKRLLASNETNGVRKIVGFTSGLGAYGELNLSISTEQDTLSQLSDKIKNHLDRLLPFQSATDFDVMAARIVGESEEIIGLASLRAVVGKGEKIREVIGFSAIRRALSKPNTQISQLLPVDSLLHWFEDSEVNQRPDLLQLSLVMREDDIPLIEAILIECKFGQHNVSHLNKANDQIQDGLKHLTQLFIPNRSDINRVSFDRRYWWAQLQRAITSRSVVSMSEQQRKKLDVALEQLAEGYYEMTWQAAIFTFWTDDTHTEIETTAISLPKDIVLPPLQVPDNFKVWHIAMSCQKIISLFKNEADANHLELPNAVIRIRPENDSFFTKTESLDNSLESIEITEKSNNDQTDFETKPEILAIVQTIESKNDEVAIEVKPTETDFKISVSVDNVPPDKILIGTKSNGEGVYWYYGHPQLANRHLLLFGTSGSGKTYGIQCLLAEMAKQRMRSLIIDYTDGFLPQQIETRFFEIANPQNHFVITDKLPLNPFRRQQQIIDPSIPAIEENPYQVATRVSSIFTSVFNTMGDQQSSALIRVLETGIAEDAKFSLSSLLERLHDDDSKYGESLANKLEPFIRAEPFREGVDSAWEQMLTSPKHSVHVLQLKGLAREIQKLVTEFALWDLYDYACNTGSKDRPIPIVLDEIQNLDHRSDSPIDKMLREGRKFGLSLILATQTTSQFNQEQRDRLFQAGHKLFFKPADTEIDRFAGLLSLSTNEPKAIWVEQLAKLQKGQCWSLGPVLTSGGNLQTKAVLVSVTALEDRDFEG